MVVVLNYKKPLQLEKLKVPEWSSESSCCCCSTVCKVELNDIHSSDRMGMFWNCPVCDSLNMANESYFAEYAVLKNKYDIHERKRFKLNALLKTIESHESKSHGK
jgi:hypothetical protein